MADVHSFSEARFETAMLDQCVLSKNNVTNANVTMSHHVVQKLGGSTRKDWNFPTCLHSLFIMARTKKYRPLTPREVAKPLLEKDYLEGRITNDMPPREVRALRPEYEAVKKESFRTT